MKKLFTLSLCLLGLSFISNAQQVKPLSLNEAVQTAVQKRDDIQIGQLTSRISENEVKKLRSKNLPQLTADLDARYYTQLQTNIIPGAAFGIPGGDKRVQFGTPYNALAGFNFNQNLLNPTNASDRQISQAQAEYDKASVTLTEITVKQEVTQAYFTVLLWKEKKKLSDRNVMLTSGLYTTGKDQLQQGAITNYDLQKYRIDYENALSIHQNNTSSYLLSLSDLFYKMGEDSIYTDSLTDNINSLYEEYSKVNLGDQKINRPELELEKMQSNIYSLNVRKQNHGYLPTVSFFANYSWQYLNTEFTPFNGNNWYPYSYLGFKVSLPLFDGFLKERTKTEYKMRGELSKLRYEKMVRDYSQETQSALVSIKNAQADLDAQKNNLALSNDLYTIDSQRLKDGVIKPNDLTLTYYTLQQTQTNYLNAAYNYLVAVVNYKKAIGSL